MRRLAQRLEEEGVDSELRRYCERILRVRSTGWTQGIFANFAAESMVPKGAEWGGGNWEIKTPTDMKDIPQWELAAEVMPYMKTDDGAIPSIITDHIGVYLGSIKGRGNIVPVREDTLVNVLTPAGVDGKPAGIQTSVAAPNLSKGALSKGESLMGLEALGKQFGVSTAADEQAKAEEEFKKSMFSPAADGSSSDEEGVPKKKLQIKIKPASSAVVDMNKLKEATGQFKLGPPPLSRTKSLDIGQGLPQPAATGTPAAHGVANVAAPTAFVPGSAPSDLFTTDALTQPTRVPQQGSMTAGVGVAAGPIPEDFFRDTIPSLQVAATLRPAGTFLSRMDQASQGSESEKVVPSQASTPVADIGFPDGGVPPQASQQPVPLDSIGLPDGGIPPQSAGRAVVMPQVPAQMAQVPVSTQPLDLSVLGVPADSGKPSVRPASPPSSVRPGQVKIHYLHRGSHFVLILFS